MAERQGLSAHIQDSIAFLAITSTPFLKLVRNFVKPDILSSDAVYWVVKSCYQYYDLAKEAPGDHICDVLDDQIRGLNESKRELVYHFLDRVSTMKAPNFDYVISKLNAFVKTREFELGAVEFVKLVDKQRFNEAELLMYTILRRGIEREERGYKYTTDPLLRVEDEEDILVGMGVKDFDALRKFHRSELLVLLGGYKGKKSFCATHIGIQGLLHGLNVLHVSHENSKLETLDRYDRGIGSLLKRADSSGDVEIRYIDESTGKLRTTTEWRPSVSDPEAQSKARKTIRRFGGELYVQKYPMYQCTVEELERYMDYLERFEDFVPDILINDYPDIMLPSDPRAATRDTLNHMYMVHKRWADERRMLVVVVSQARREAIRAKRLSQKDFAEDIRKLGNCDTAVGVCQTDTQSSAGLASLYIIGARKGIDNCGCGIVQNLDIGQFASCSFKLQLGVKVADEEGEANNDDEASSTRTT